MSFLRDLRGLCGLKISWLNKIHYPFIVALESGEMVNVENGMGRF